MMYIESIYYKIPIYLHKRLESEILYIELYTWHFNNINIMVKLIFFLSPWIYFSFLLDRYLLPLNIRNSNEFQSQTRL